MDNTIIYRPYEDSKWVSLLLLLCTMLCYFWAGYFGFHRFDDLIACIICIIVGALSVWMSKRIYDSSRITIRFELKEIRIIDDSYDDYHFIHWENLLCAYYIYNTKGKQYLILSPKECEYNEVKRLVNRLVISEKVYVNNCIIISCGFTPTPTVLKIKELVEQRVPNVHTF